MDSAEVRHRACRACSGRQVCSRESFGRRHGERIECVMIAVSVCWRGRVIPVCACSRMRTRGGKCILCSDPHSTGARTAQARQLLVIQKEATRRSWATVRSRSWRVEEGVRGATRTSDSAFFCICYQVRISNQWLDAEDPPRSEADSYGCSFNAQSMSTIDITHAGQMTWSRDPGGTPAYSRVAYFQPVDHGASTTES